MDPALLTLATVEAPHAAEQKDVEAVARMLFERADFDVDDLARVYARAGVERRTFALPLDAYGAGLAAGQRNDCFLRSAGAMLTEAAERALPAALRERVTHVVTICSTGIATPSLECEVIDALGISPRARRVPVFGLGCAGGAAGLQLARDLASGAPEALVLLLCVELTSLTFLASDRSPQNFVACALFGDGAAAALVGGRAYAGGALARIGRSTSRLLPDSRDLMGWDVRADGWRVVFSPRIPALVRREARGLVASVADQPPRHWVLHPGGRKILEAYAAVLELDEHALEPATATLARHGNMSAVTVLFVLERVLAAADFAPGPAVLTAFGPGFTAEALALELLAAR